MKVDYTVTVSVRSIFDHDADLPKQRDLNGSQADQLNPGKQVLFNCPLARGCIYVPEECGEDTPFDALLRQKPVDMQAAAQILWNHNMPNQEGMRRRIPAGWLDFTSIYLRGKTRYEELYLYKCGGCRQAYTRKMQREGAGAKEDENQEVGCRADPGEDCSSTTCEAGNQSL